jgi:N-acetylglucosamine kinase-like BadF-type ATPase
VAIVADTIVLGGDLGGTSTRILICDTAGRVVGRGVAGGSNPVSHPDTAAAALGIALAGALAGLDPSEVRVAVIGAAGGTALARPGTAGQFQAVWSDAGLPGAPTYIGDIEVAFASATTAPDGTALIAGTGAGGAEIRDHQIVRTADLHGWLLGDDGSGYWLGREAARATLRAIDDGDPLGELGEAVVSALLGDRRSVPLGGPGTDRSGFDAIRDELIRVANSRPPVRLAELAVTVATAYATGDPAAISIAERAADLLVGTLRRVRPPDAVGPLVLAGSVAGEASPVGRLLRERLSGDIAEILTARDGVAGAAWLALALLDPALATDQAHAALLSG